MSTALKFLFGTVKELSHAFFLEEVENGARVPFSDGSFDLVTAYRIRPSSVSLKEIRRILDVDGTLMLGVSNRWWYGRLKRNGAHGAQKIYAGPKLIRRIRSAGFNHVRQYFVEPSLAVPRSVIPARNSSVQAHLTFAHREEGHRWQRVLLGRLGGQEFLFPARLILAWA